MTLSAAEILDLNDRLGSIEAGKIANLAVVKNDVFASDRFVPYVFVDGKLFEQKEQPRGGGRGPGGQRGGGAGPASPATAPNVANVAGTYNLSIDAPGQTLTGTLILRQQGDTISGTMTTQLGVVQIAGGKASATGFSFSATADVGGTTIDITFRATVSSNNLSGTIDTPQGPVPVTGTKTP
jgi:hypothetical protein